MKRTALVKAAISSLLIGTTMVGCTGMAFRPSAVAEPASSTDRMTAAVEKALAERDGARAVQSAEAAVAAAPQDAHYRQLLGRAYVANGRFASAETALNDALTLGDRNARTIISLALVQVALGKSDAARELLAGHADVVPAADYGLAMAMAGDAEEGVRILAEVIQDPSATARTRQNLAYAYALAGRWKDARAIAGMDLEPLAANQRIAQWAQTAAADFAPQRIASLMGVTIDGADAGLPVALALAPQAAPAAVAQAPSPAEELASAPDEPAQPYASTLEEQAPSASFAAVAAPKPVFAPRPAQPSRTAVAPRRIQAAYRPVSRAASNWVVQLGAYENVAVAKEKWAGLSRRYNAVASRPVITSQVTVNGASYARLAVSGFGDRAEATELCRAIRARRGQCFVRENGVSAAPQRWALSAKGRQLASR